MRPQCGRHFAHRRRRGRRGPCHSPCPAHRRHRAKNALASPVGPRRPVAAVEMAAVAARHVLSVHDRAVAAVADNVAMVRCHVIALDLEDGAEAALGALLHAAPLLVAEGAVGAAEGGAHIDLVLRGRLRACRRRRRREVLLDRIGHPQVDCQLHILRLEAVEGGGRQHRRQLLQPERRAAAVVIGRGALDMIALLLLLRRIHRRGVALEGFL